MIPSQPKDNADPAAALAEALESLRGTAGIHETDLTVDDRVLARVTEGIYRRPASSLRELVFNAYDADATRVIIETDAPSFQRISIRDNGLGMDERALADLVKHIGGSSKRTYKGIQLGTVNPHNTERSPAGRPLIGKIGIGLFAVTHLTNHFRIITKRRGASHRLVSEIWMKTSSEEALKRAADQSGREPKFQTGTVSFAQEPAVDLDAHGTEIILLDLRRSAREELGSRETWAAILEEEDAAEKEQRSTKGRERPLFHIGYASDASPGAYAVEPRVPWASDQAPEEKFRALYQAIVAAKGSSTKNPDIEKILDTYLATLWRLSLAAPLPYLGGHPFEMAEGSGVELFMLQNRSRAQAMPLALRTGETIGAAAELESLERDPCGAFAVLVDGVDLRRPVVLHGELIGAKAKARQKMPLLFVGKARSSQLESMPDDRGGGPLEFEAYFYWNSTIVPNQNRGVLIRINGASGVLYDDRFMDYQVAELTRLKQITAEVFVIKGMDAALNIDRESFNVSHPHYQYLAGWVHAALRQITNRLKEVGKESLTREKQMRQERAASTMEKMLQGVWDRAGDDLRERPDVEVVPASSGRQREIDLRREDGLAFHLDPIEIERAEVPGDKGLPPALEQAKGVMQLLAAYGVIDEMPYDRQQELFEDLCDLLMIGRV